MSSTEVLKYWVKYLEYLVSRPQASVPGCSSFLVNLMDHDGVLVWRKSSAYFRVTVTLVEASLSVRLLGALLLLLLLLLFLFLMFGSASSLFASCFDRPQISLHFHNPVRCGLSLQ
ncbi:hypothetical protein EYF80_024056 [Liparis tanakae]|uniref:Uncharacterized protein n=1 Tax=Liparis tanakae TaxID=230148 RepID=A0A4Z2HL90_9TELE|nr:hypothetical protein EYF80_024056 [Liparis tanakae]